jgi:hypothetical protein
MNRTHEPSEAAGRRATLKGLVGSLALMSGWPRMAWSGGSSGNTNAAAQYFNSLLRELAHNSRWIDAMRSEHSERFGLESSEERAPIETPPSKTPIDARASDLIVACEVGSRHQYERMYESPTWPKGRSGITIGVGYDIGYSTVDSFKSDWAPYLSAERLSQLSEACGIYAHPAQQLLARLGGIVVDWQTASAQFYARTQPRYVGQTEAALPNCALLNGVCLGALVSLTYNRGPSFGVSAEHDPTGRYAEMRNINSHMRAREFDRIPCEIRAMKRLWQGVPDMAGLLTRREAEAALFEIGLAQQKAGA